LFGKAKGTISEHIKHIFEDGELSDEAVVRFFRTTGPDGAEGERETLRFFAFMQNKMHFAATGLTAAEIVRQRANADHPNMGLTSWSGGRVMKRDVGTAKNYLDEKEIDTLNRITVMFLDQAEFRAQRRKDIKVADWATALDKFLRDTELPVLAGPGTVSHEEALDWADNTAPSLRVAASKPRKQEAHDTWTTSRPPRSCSRAKVAR